MWEKVRFIDSMRVHKRLGIIFLILSILLAISNGSRIQSKIDISENFRINGNDNSYLFFSTFLGGSDNDEGMSIAIDDYDNIYLTGFTDSIDFPVMNAYNETSNGGTDIFLSSFTSDGELRWSTYFGGNDEDMAFDIALDRESNIYITGHTSSTNFPLKNEFDDKFSDFADAFVSSFHNNGTLRWSSYLGGEDWDAGSAIDIDSNGNIIVSGHTNSADFPLFGSFNDTHSGGTYDAFVTSILPNGTISWSRLFGGDSHDYVHDLVIDGNNRIYLAGFTYSTDFPVYNPYQETPPGGFGDGFVISFDESGSLLMSTYFGGSEEDTITGISIDSKGNLYLTGFTHSIDFPILNANYDYYGGGLTDVFVSSLSNNGSLRWSTFHGGIDYDDGYGIMVDSNDIVHVIGQTFSWNFATLSDYSSDRGELYDVFTSGYSTEGKLEWSVRLAGIDIDKSFGLTVDKKGNLIITGKTLSSDFPINNEYDSSFNGGRAPLYAYGHDVFVSYLATPIFDYDDDGLNNLREFEIGLDLRNSDTDSDGMLDTWEYENGLNPLQDDSQLDFDADKLSNYDEYTLGTLVNDNDTDNDLMPDGWEVTYGLNPFEDDSTLDFDGDGFNNLYEYQHNMDPTISDGLTTITEDSTKIAIPISFTSIILTILSLTIIIKKSKV